MKRVPVIVENDICHKNLVTLLAGLVLLVSPLICYLLIFTQPLKEDVIEVEKKPHSYI